MTTINRLTSVSAVTAGDLVPIWDQDGGGTRGAAMSVIAAYLQGAEAVGVPAFTMQYATPGATGFTVAITGGQKWVWLILTPLAGYAAGTITLPAGPLDQQEMLVACTQVVTTLTLAGGTVVGAPTTLAGGAFFRMKFNGLMNAWYRVG